MNHFITCGKVILISPLFPFVQYNQQFKVRKTLSYSLHEVAKILGQKLTEEQLLNQVLEPFLKDIDEVKLGVLSHIAEFLSILSVPSRKRYLKLVVDLQADKNWRFRKLIAK